MSKSIKRIAIVLGAVCTIGACGPSGKTTVLSGQEQRGKHLFEENCAACHALRAVSDQTIPSLKDIIGRRVGASGFPYSPAMRSADFVWNEDRLDQFLADPRGFLPNNQMAFFGMPNAKDREDLIAFVALHSDKAGQ